jgi:hypothetical protein
MRKVALSILGILALGIGAFYYSRYREYRRSPLYSLLQIRKAVQEHDVGTFKRYVDLDEVVERGIDQAMRAEAAGPKVESSAADETSESVANLILAIMKPGLAGIVKEKVIRYVETGQWEQHSGVEPKGATAGSGAPPEEGQSSAIAADPITSFHHHTAEIRFDGMGSITREGKTAYVGFKFFDKRYDLPFTLNLKMWDMGGYWQVAEIINLGDVVGTLNQLEASRKKEKEQEQARKIEALNAGIRAAIGKSLEVVGADKITNYRVVLIGLYVKNVGRVDVKSFRASITVADSSGRIRARTSDGWDVTIAPGQVEGCEWPVNPPWSPNEDDDIMFLQQTPQDRLRIAAEITSVTFADGKVLKLVDHLPD